MKLMLLFLTVRILYEAIQVNPYSTEFHYSQTICLVVDEVLFTIQS